MIKVGVTGLGRGEAAVSTDSAARYDTAVDGAQDPRHFGGQRVSPPESGGFHPHPRAQLPRGRPSDGPPVTQVQEVEAQVPKRVEARVAARAS